MTADGIERSPLVCVGCGNEIHPGDKREPSSEGTIHTVCRLRREAREHYRFFIRPHEDGVSRSLFYIEDGREHPIVYNTGGADAVSSADTRFADELGIEPTEHFIKALSYTFHWLLSYRPLPHDIDRLDKEIESEFPRYYPNGKVPFQELWAVKLLLKQLYRHPVAPPEFGPIVECCDAITAFRVPEAMEYEK